METLTYEYPAGVKHEFKDGDYVSLKVFSFQVNGVNKYQYYFGYLKSDKNSKGKISWRVDIRNITLNNLLDGTDTMELIQEPKKPLVRNNESNEITYQTPSVSAINAMNQVPYGGKRSRRKRKSRKSRKSRSIIR